MNSFEQNPNVIAFKNHEERDQLSDEMISLRFLEQISDIMSYEDISKKELAKRLKTSPSYVTQLFQGDKLINVRLLTKLKRALNISIDITCRPISNAIFPLTKQIGLSKYNSINLHLSLPEQVNLINTITFNTNQDSSYKSDNTYIMIEDEKTGYFTFDPKSSPVEGYGSY